MSVGSDGWDESLFGTWEGGVILVGIREGGGVPLGSWDGGGVSLGSWDGGGISLGSWEGGGISLGSWEGGDIPLGGLEFDSSASGESTGILTLMMVFSTLALGSSKSRSVFSYSW